jgi:hypothetical protein
MDRAWAWVVLLVASAAVAAPAGDSKLPQLGYEFTLQKGLGVPVCEAYVLRLRATRFARPPYCGRPENDSVRGFEKLARVPLTRTEIEHVFASAEGLLRFGDPEFYEKHERDAHTRTHPARAAAMYADDQEERLAGGWPPFAYRFDPQIDIDNDGEPDSVVAWKQPGVTCGAVKRVYPERFTTHLLLLDDEGAVDVTRTRRIFGHPMGSILEYTDPSGHRQLLDLSNRFRAIGDMQGTFSYRGKFYLDTFYASTGDLENNRVDEPYITDTLAVLLRSGGKTSLQCEILWHDPDHEWDKRLEEEGKQPK